MQGIKWGGLLPIFSLVSRHCSGVATGGAAACTAGTPTRTTKDLRARARGGVPGKPCPDRPPWVLYHDRDFSVATGFGCSVSRHNLSVSTRPGLWAVSRQACTIEHPARDREFSVATGFTMFSVATKKSLSLSLS